MGILRKKKIIKPTGNILHAVTPPLPDQSWHEFIHTLYPEKIAIRNAYAAAQAATGKQKEQNNEKLLELINHATEDYKPQTRKASIPTHEILPDATPPPPDPPRD